MRSEDKDQALDETLLQNETRRAQESRVKINHFGQHSELSIKQLNAIDGKGK